MGHFQGGKHGPGPFNLGPWVISKAENMDLGYLIWAHGPFPKWKTWTRAIILSPWVIYMVMNLDLGHLIWAHGPFPKWQTWTRANEIVPMGHFQSRKHRPGPLKLSPWVISMMVNLDQGHLF